MCTPSGLKEWGPGRGEGRPGGFWDLTPKLSGSQRVKENPGENGRFCSKRSPQSIRGDCIALYSCAATAQLGRAGGGQAGGWEEWGAGQSHLEAISGAFIQKSIKVLVALKLK